MKQRVRLNDARVVVAALEVDVDLQLNRLKGHRGVESKEPGIWEIHYTLWMTPKIFECLVQRQFQCSVSQCREFLRY